MYSGSARDVPGQAVWGVGCGAKAGIFGVVGDVCFGSEWEVDWVAVEDSFYVETLM